MLLRPYVALVFCSEIPLSVDWRTAIGAISWGMAGSFPLA
jgi:hypothetical protein